MSSVVILRARHAIIAMGLMAAFLGNASASPNTITVQRARPVAEAIEELEKRYGWQITYEDPPYVYYGDITDVSDTNWPGVPVQSPSQLQAAQQPANQRTLVPKGGSLTFTLPSADPDELGAVEALLKSYNASRGGNVFAVVRGASLLHVVPRQVTGLSGNLEPVKPVLDALITIEPRKRTSYEFIEEVLKKVSIATNTHVAMATIAPNLLHRTTTSIGGSGRTARSILEQWILERHSRFSWLLLYSPDYDKGYDLNISLVSPDKTIILLPRPLPAAKP
jgi:hypothetical protein